MTSSESIALTGLKHVGKTTIGRRLSQVLGLDFVDVDELLVRRAVYENILSAHHKDPVVAEPPIRDVYRALGSVKFAAWESDALRDIPTTYQGTAIVLATGGGICDHPGSMELLRTGYRVLYLSNDPIVLYQRATKHGTPAFLDGNRPREHFMEIAQQRDVVYRSYADRIVDITGLSIDDATAQITAHYKG